MNTPIIAPSLLSANFARLEQELKALEEAKVPWLHLDIMDGNFVPNITFGPPVIAALRKISSLYFDTHLMIEAPERYVDDFFKAGANMLVVHVEATVHLQRTLASIRALGMQAGVSLNPSTSLSSIEYVLDDVDMILLMSVNPGFSGQSFIPATYHKIRDLRQMLHDAGKSHIKIQVDGGVDPHNIAALIDCGADVFVSGSAFFSKPPYDTRLQDFIDAAALAKRKPLGGDYGNA